MSNVETFAKGEMRRKHLLHNLYGELRIAISKGVLDAQKAQTLFDDCARRDNGIIRQAFDVVAQANFLTK